MLNVEILNQKLKKIQEEIELIQNNCNHKNQNIKFDGKNNARWFCDNCTKNVRIPSSKELQYWIRR